MSKQASVKVWFDKHWHISLNGQDISDVLSPDGFRVDFVATAGLPRPRVTLTLFPDVLDAEIPDALVSTIKPARPRDGYIAGGFNGYAVAINGSGVVA